MTSRVGYILIGVVGFALVAAIFLGIARRRVPEPTAAAPRPVEPAPAETAAPAKDAVQTESVVPANLQQKQAMAPDTEPAAEKPKKERDPNAPFTPGPTSLEDRLTRAAEQQELTARWAKESPDQDWEKRTADRMTTLLAQNSINSHALSGVECRETICRFNLKSESGRDRHVHALIGAARALDEQTWLLHEEQPDGTWALQVYYPREGYRLSGGGGKIGEMPQVVDAPNLRHAEARRSPEPLTVRR